MDGPENAPWMSGIDWSSPLTAAPSPYQYPLTYQPGVTIITTPMTPPVPERLSDGDVERIAKRVAELLKARNL